MKTFTINGKTYEAKEFTFNDICKFEDMGINLLAIGEDSSKIFSLVRAYLAICLNTTPDNIGSIVEDIDFEEVMEAFSYSVENSGFFRTLTKRTEEKVGAVQKKK